MRNMEHFFQFQAVILELPKKYFLIFISCVLSILLRNSLWIFSISLLKKYAKQDIKQTLAWIHKN